MGRKHLTLERHCRGSHFTWEERLRLQYYWNGSNGYKKERSPTALGILFQKSPKTIKNELFRGMVEHLKSNLEKVMEYNAYHAQLDAELKMGGKGPNPKSGKHFALVKRISNLILEHNYSPYAVLVTLDRENAWPDGIRICEKTLYNWIEAGDIPDVTIENLPRKGKLKRKKHSSSHRKHNNVEFANRSIEKRPDTINNRRECGHWEGDTVYSVKNGSRECLLTLVERKTRLEVVIKLKNRTAASVTCAFDRLERKLGSKQFRNLFKSVTFDNGVEFSDVYGLEKSILTRTNRTTLFYAHPYCSSERGTNENHNGIIRRFLPKGTDFALVNDKTIREVQNWMNNYPRKILNGYTPLMAFKEEFELNDKSIRLLEAC